MPTTPRARNGARGVLTVPVLLAIVPAVAALGCGREEERNARASRVEATAPVAEECSEEDVPPGVARLVTTADDGEPIAGAVAGHGDTAVVLVHGAGQDLCDWIDLLPALADLGVTAVAYDLRGRGASGGSRDDVAPLPRDLAALVDAVRQRGAERVVLVGTSLGAGTALASAGSIEPPVDAVVGISPPMKLAGAEVGEQARRYSGPTFLVAAQGDETFVENMGTLAGILPDTRATVALEGSEHGMRLFKARPEEVTEVIRQAVDAAGGA